MPGVVAAQPPRLAHKINSPSPSNSAEIAKKPSARRTLIEAAPPVRSKRVAWKLFQEHVGEGLPVSAVIYSHTHADHWGGVRGIVDEADVRSGKIPLIAPVDFMDYSMPVAAHLVLAVAANR